MKMTNDNNGLDAAAGGISIEKDPITLAIDAFQYLSDWQQKDGSAVVNEVAEDGLKALRPLQSQPAAVHENGSYEGLMRDCRTLEAQRDKYLNFIIRESRGCDLRSHLDEMEEYTGRRERIVPQSRQPLPHSTEGTDLHRSNMEKTENGFRVCSGLHDKNAPCEWVYYELKVEQPLPSDKQAALTFPDPSKEESWSWHDEYDFWYIGMPVTEIKTSRGDFEHGMSDRGFKPWELFSSLTAPQPVADLDELKHHPDLSEYRHDYVVGYDNAWNACIDHLHATGRLTTSTDVQELKDAVRDLVSARENFQTPDVIIIELDDAIVKHAQTIAKVKGV